MLCLVQLVPPFYQRRFAVCSRRRFHLDYVSQIGETMGSLGGLAAGALVPLAFGISPVFSIILGLSLIKVSLLPAFITGIFYLLLLSRCKNVFQKGLTY